MSSAPSTLSFDLQRHLYASFLAQQTSDVTLRVRGSWSAIYKLHRVILIQAEFFKSLFTSGFVESKSRSFRKTDRTEWIDIVFDDPNITRATFEICIARLYGGGPQLYIPPSLIPTPTHPLTPSPPFYNSSDLDAPNLQYACPPDYHPASPRFLLSLLATSAFLSIPRVASQALTSILREPDPEVDYEDPVAAVGLESVAELIEEEGEGIVEGYVLTPDKDEQIAEKLDEMHLDETTKHCGSPDATSFMERSHSSSSGDTSGSNTPSREFHYGGLSDKVGEAAMCWLTRWAADICRYEDQEDSRTNDTTPDIYPATQLFSSSTTRKRAATIPSGTATDAEFAHPSKMLLSLDGGVSVPSIWRRGGLTADWVRRVLSSDALFVTGEKERYDLCRTIVDMRRREGIEPAEEAQWEALFERGIYYSTMILEQLMSIAQDISPVTGQPYVPLQVLQSAHWEFSLLQHHITSRPGSSPTSPTKQREKRYHPVPGDSSTRIGDSTGLEGASMDQLFDSSGSRPLNGSGSRTVNQRNSQSNWFGLEQQAYSASDCARHDSQGKIRWSPYPPLRFGVEFWDVDSLKEKSRLHSHTVWYAGSLWNVYVQVVRKKTVQLGVYLHRQSSVDPIPPSSAPLTFPLNRLSNMRSMQDMSSQNQTTTPSRSSTPHATSSSTSSSTTPNGRPSSLPSSYSSSSLHGSQPSKPNTVPATAQPIIPLQPYRDPRPKVGAYFAISCASATGGSLTRFTSAPDEFSVSQSWGWKSSSLRTEEFLEVMGDGMIKPGVSAMGKEVSLRATVIVGLV
ncbi:unnamed protein product [Somion occarium]|uniref:BTB domain-containing protein n=1 Tax=Somion occarium TaxID=3059160 RepID=A0ABP1CM72_9APHY